jgi:hypothetical protein
MQMNAQLKPLAPLYPGLKPPELNREDQGGLQSQFEHGSKQRRHHVCYEAEPSHPVSGQSLY